jgi:hypothetical protein
VTSSPAARERRLVYAVVVVLVLFRSLLFTFTELSYDSDQAVIGLMAKHLAHGRAFPLFMYGQNYMLGVEAWMAAPFVLIFGTTVAAVKFPILLVNLAIALLLVRLLERDCGLRPRHALVASLFFVLAPAGTVGTIQEASGGTGEPLLYLLLLWLTRRRPVWFGLVAAIGMIHREFTVYGVGVILAMAMVDGAWRRPDSRRAFGRGVLVFAGTWIAVYCLRPLASAMGPGTGAVIPGQPTNQVAEIFNRMCFDAGTIGKGFGGLVTQHWAQLFGTSHQPLSSFGLESASWQGLTWSGPLLGIAALLITARALMHVRFSTQFWQRYGFAIYLAAVGTISAVMYVVARCGTESPLRYDTLSLFLAAAIAAVFLATEQIRPLRATGIAVIVAWAGVASIGHVQLWAEYVPHAPVTAKDLVIRNLEARGIRYATSDYWMAYHITYLTNERIIVSAEEMNRIQEYRDIVEAHKAEAIRISRRPCGTEPPVIPGVYFCPIQ